MAPRRNLLTTNANEDREENLNKRIAKAFEAVQHNGWIHPESYVWKLRDVSDVMESSGPVGVQEGISVAETFKLLWDINVVNNIATAINNKLPADILPVDAEEMYKYEAQFLLMCVHPKKIMKDHWKQTSVENDHFISRDRWLLLHRNMSFDRFEMVDTLRDNYQEHWNPGFVVNWDEIVWETRARTPYHVYIPRKPHANGLLIYEETCISTEIDFPYLYDLLPYMTEDRPDTLSVAQHFTNNWKQDALHHVVADAWFPSYGSMELLDRLGAFYTFSCPSTRWKYLWTLMEWNLKYPGYRMLHLPSLNRTALLWCHNTKVKMMTNGFDPYPSKGEEDPKLPTTIVNFYKQHFNGCDRFNKYAYLYRFPHKMRKWNHQLQSFLLMATVINAWNLWLHANSPETVDLSTFIETLAFELVEL